MSDHAPLPLQLAPWGDLRVVRPLTGGTRNAVWLAEAPAGKAVVKTTRRSAASLLWLAGALERARRSGLHVPRLHRTRDGRLSVGGLIVEDAIDGAHATNRDLPALDPALNRFHRATRGLPPRPGLLPSAVLAGAAGDDDTDFAALPAPLARACRDALGRLSRRPTSAVHGDVGPGNVIRGTDGRLWLIDWDEARRDVPAFDRSGPERARDPAVETARLAREVLIFWQSDPRYARMMGRRLIARTPRRNVF